jgi:hypothetical protein
VADEMMSPYEKTLKTINEVKTLAAHMVSLGKIRMECEDAHLDGYIVSQIRALQFQHQHSSSRSTPLALTFFPTNETQWLSTYCQQFIKQKKPEWQVLAERHGWQPPSIGV